MRPMSGRAMAASPLWGVLVASFISLAAPALVSATEEGRSTFDTQVGVARAALSAGNLDQALALGDAAIRMSPERWDGYAIAGQALLGLRQYEPAADALSKAIERAPDAQQGVLRDLRRECLVAESASPASSPAAPPTAPGALKASAPVASSNQGGMLPPSPRAIERPVATSQARPDPAVWLDASTGLMWARPWYYPKDGMAGPWNLSDAQSFCSMLDLGGYSHWRLPTVDELQHVFRVSSEGWRWSRPAFDPEYGIDEALEQKRWRPSEFVVGGDHFQGNRLLLWTSTPAEKPGEHVGMYFGNRYSVRDDQRLGSSFEGSARRTPYQGYALCMRSPG